MKELYLNSFLDKTIVQEKATGKFICPDCLTCMGSNEEFENHLSENHKDYDRIRCIYCELDFRQSNISSHIESHFIQNRLSSNICNLCNKFVKMDCLESILEHLQYHHYDDMICPICTVKYTQYSEFSDHINANIVIVYHCDWENCSVKTNIEEEMIYHRNLFSHTGNVCFEEHIFNCTIKNDPCRYNYVDDIVNYDDDEDNDNHDNANDDNDMPVETPDNHPQPIDKFHYIIELYCPEDSINNPFLDAGIKEKLISIDTFYIGVTIQDSKKIFHCSSCNYSSQYSHADARKHILLCHCAIGCANLRTCMRTVRFCIAGGSISDTENVESPPNDIDNHLNGNKLNKESPVKKHGTKKDEVSTEDANLSKLKKSKLSVENVDIDFPSKEKDQRKTDFRDEMTKTEPTVNEDIPQVKVMKIDLNSDFDGRRRSYDKPVRKITENRRNKDFLSISELDEILDQGCSVPAELPHRYLPLNDTNQSAIPAGKLSQIFALQFHDDIFDEQFQNVHHDIRLKMRNALSNIVQFSIKVTDTNNQKIYHCIECPYASKHSHSDVRKHIIMVHLLISHLFIRQCMRTTKFMSGFEGNPPNVPIESSSKKKFITERKSTGSILTENQNIFKKPKFNEEIFSDNNNNISTSVSQKNKENLSAPHIKSPLVLQEKEAFPMPSQRKKSLPKQKKSQTNIFRMDYCENEFDDFYREFDSKSVGELKEKLEKFKQFSIEVTVDKEGKWFQCSECHYRSSHNSGDVKKHMMSKHCGIHHVDVRNCVKFFRSDPNCELAPPKENDGDKGKTIVDDNCDSPLKFDFKRTQLTEDKSCDIVAKQQQQQRQRVVIVDEINPTYSETILRALCNIENQSHRFTEFKERLIKVYCQTKIKIGQINNDNRKSVFICSNCNWTTMESLSRVSNHIIDEHTGIAKGFLSMIKMCTKLTDEGLLMSDNDISQLGWGNRPILSETAKDEVIDLTN